MSQPSCPTHGKQWMIRDHKRELWYCQYQQYAPTAEYLRDGGMTPEPFTASLCGWSITTEAWEANPVALNASTNPYAWNELDVGVSHMVARPNHHHHNNSHVGSDHSDFTLDMRKSAVHSDPVKHTGLSWLRGRVQEYQAIGREAIGRGKAA